MTYNFKITIEYDGSLYHGWQKQKSVKTIQEEIEKAVKKITRQKISLIGSGRTDAGVHAYGQAANFLCDTNIECESLQKGLNSILPDDIVICECKIVNENFHARYNAKSKVYNYCILNSKNPAAIFRNYGWFIRKKLDIASMKAAVCHIVGTHDFKAFEGTGSPRANTLRTIIKAEIIKQKDSYILFEVEADGFLRYMVRNIIGSIVDVGLGKITPQEFRAIRESKDRSLAGITAPALGLFLMKVKY